MSILLPSAQYRPSNAPGTPFHLQPFYMEVFTRWGGHEGAQQKTVSFPKISSSVGVFSFLAQQQALVIRLPTSQHLLYSGSILWLMHFLMYPEKSHQFGSRTSDYQQEATDKSQFLAFLQQSQRSLFIPDTQGKRGREEVGGLLVSSWAEPNGKCRWPQFQMSVCSLRLPCDLAQLL